MERLLDVLLAWLPRRSYINDYNLRQIYPYEDGIGVIYHYGDGIGVSGLLSSLLSPCSSFC